MSKKKEVRNSFNEEKEINDLNKGCFTVLIILAVAIGILLVIADTVYINLNKNKIKTYKNPNAGKVYSGTSGWGPNRTDDEIIASPYIKEFPEEEKPLILQNKWWSSVIIAICICICFYINAMIRLNKRRND